MVAPTQGGFAGQRVLVVGAGFMGAGIAQVCAARGLRVSLSDVSPPSLDRARAGIAASLQKLGGKGLLPASPDTVLARIGFGLDLSPAAKADWIIEAALEDLELKLKLFTELDRLARPQVVLASNTSSIPITKLAAAAQHPERVLGLHFFGPVPLMGLVEVVKGQATSPEVFERSAEFIRFLGKTPVKVTRDIPGFVMNRVFSAAFREAVDLVAEGVVSPEDLDAGMRLGYGWAAGPFEIADNAGLDTCLLINRFLVSVGEKSLTPRSDLVERLVAQGRVGRKVGKGFYRYTPDGKRQPWREEQ
jgi:3-hydroxybutyryl-CoA dehydrogenase